MSSSDSVVAEDREVESVHLGMRVRHSQSRYEEWQSRHEETCE
jgi:hypothetical protein